MINKIGILTGGDSAERDISLKTSAAVEEACRDLGYAVIRIVVDGDVSKLIDNLHGIDFVFIALHGGKGENGVIQGLLDSLGIRYNGPGVLASSLGMEKSISKQLVRCCGILTPAWKAFDDYEKSKKFVPEKYPVVVKPSAEGSTLGLSFVRKQAELIPALELASQYNGGIIIEEYIAGKELTVSIVGQKVLPIVEILPSHKFYDYECKYEEGMSDYVCPAKLPDSLTNRIRNIALDIFKILKCSGYARADFILDQNNKPWFLEINTLPGMTKTSLVPKSAMAAGISFNTLIQMIIDEALVE